MFDPVLLEWYRLEWRSAGRDVWRKINGGRWYLLSRRWNNSIIHKMKNSFSGCIFGLLLSWGELFFLGGPYISVSAVYTEELLSLKKSRWILYSAFKSNGMQMSGFWAMPQLPLLSWLQASAEWAYSTLFFFFLLFLSSSTCCFTSEWVHVTFNLTLKDSR